MAINKTFDPKNICIIIDQQEKQPLDFRPLGIRTTSQHLETGDYSVVGFQRVCSIERKNLNDLVACVSRDRDRFERELQRLAAYPCRAIVVEATLNQVLAGGWRSKTLPQSVYGSLMAWQARNIPVHFAGTKEMAARMVFDHIRHYLKRRWCEFEPYLSFVASSQK